MPLRRSTRQRGQSFVEYYAALSQDSKPDFANAGRAMLELLPRIEEICAPADVWGLISHCDLVLLARDDYSSSRLITIMPPYDGAYRIEHYIPGDRAPWWGRSTKELTEDVAEAVHMIRSAMINCRAWPELGDNAGESRD